VQHTAGDAESANPFSAGSSATSGDARPRGASRAPGGPPSVRRSRPATFRMAYASPNQVPRSATRNRRIAPTLNSRHTRAKSANHAAN